jgi:hypothetical protein
MVWKITYDVCTFRGIGSIERRLQRDVTNIIGRRN